MSCSVCTHNHRCIYIPFGAARAGRKSRLAHCQVTLGSGLVHLEDSVPIGQSLAYCPRETCDCALPVYGLLGGHLSGSRMSGLCALPHWSPSALALDLGRPLFLQMLAGPLTYFYFYDLLGPHVMKILQYHCFCHHHSDAPH